MRIGPLNRVPLVLVFVLAFINGTLGQIPDSILQNETYYTVTDTIKNEQTEGISTPNFILTYQLKSDSDYILRKYYYHNNTQTNLLRKTYFYKGLLHGQDTTFHSLKRFSVTTWEKGKRNGPSIDYYEKDKIYIKGYFKEGLAEGTWLFYDTNGKLYKKIVYKKGETINEIAILKDE